jgi:primosomal protein N' (replication factor Y)
MGYPPFKHAIVIRVDARDPNHASRAIQIFGAELAQGDAEALGVTIRGPSPAALEKIKGRTRWAMLLTAASRSQLKSALGLLSLEDPERPKDIRVIVDVDPYDLL